MALSTDNNLYQFWPLVKLSLYQIENTSLSLTQNIHTWTHILYLWLFFIRRKFNKLLTISHEYIPNEISWPLTQPPEALAFTRDVPYQKCNTYCNHVPRVAQRNTTHYKTSMHQRATYLEKHLRCTNGRLTSKKHLSHNFYWTVHETQNFKSEINFWRLNVWWGKCKLMAYTPNGLPFILAAPALDAPSTALRPLM